MRKKGCAAGRERAEALVRTAVISRCGSEGFEAGAAVGGDGDAVGAGRDIVEQERRAPSLTSNAPIANGSKVVAVVTKRLKAARRRLEKMQDVQKRAQERQTGALNGSHGLDGLGKEEREAVERVRGQALFVEELEKVCGLVGAAVDQEREAMRKRQGGGAVEEGLKRDVRGLTGVIEQLRAENAALKRENEMLRARERAAEDRDLRPGEEHASPAVCKHPENAMGGGAQMERHVSEAVKKVVRLLYCACLFDPFVPYQVDKAAMLSWMHQSQDVTLHVDLPRFAEMLDAIGVLGKMMTRRPLGEGKSHEESVRYCQDVALRYVLGEDECVLGWSGFMTKGQLEGALGQVMESEYFKSDGLVYGGRPVCRVPDHACQMRPEEPQEPRPVECSSQREKAHAAVATPSLEEDPVRMPIGGNESVDSGSEQADDIEVSVGEGGTIRGDGEKHKDAAVTHVVAHVGPPIDDITANKVKKKLSSGKKKYGKGKQGPVPSQADNGVIQTNHVVLPQRASKRK